MNAFTLMALGFICAATFGLVLSWARGAEGLEGALERLSRVVVAFGFAVTGLVFAIISRVVR